MIFQSLRSAFIELKKNDPLRMAGATAFFTTFALPPIIFILIQLFGLIWGNRKVAQQLTEGVSNTIGPKGGEQVRQVLRSIRGFDDSIWIIIFGFIFLLFVATTLFSVIKNSFNQLWQIGVKESPGILFVLNLRLRSLAVIVFAGILFFADILSESLELIAGNYIDMIWPGGGGYIKNVAHEVIGVMVFGLWFTILFRFLADGRPTWKAAIAGGVLTAILFTAGKLLLQFLLVKSNIGKLYGASGSIVLVLLFVFYSSLILYYGASFIYAYSIKKGWLIRPTGKAFQYKIEQVDNLEIL
jgi:membrane protein